MPPDNLKLCDQILEEASVKIYLKYENPLENIKETEQSVKRLVKDGYLKVSQHGRDFLGTYYEITLEGRAFLRTGGYKGEETRQRQEAWKKWREWVAIGIAIVSLIVSLIALSSNH